MVAALDASYIVFVCRLDKSMRLGGWHLGSFLGLCFVAI